MRDDTDSEYIRALPRDARVQLEQHLELLPTAEQRLEELTRSFDRSFPNDPPTVAFMLLGIRSRTLHRGVVYSLGGPSPRSAEPALRALVEANILLRWFAQGDKLGDLGLRLGLWVAESERIRLAMQDEITRFPPLLKPHYEGCLLTDAECRRMRDLIDDARAKALAAGVRGASKKGQLIPGMAKVVDVLNDPGATHAYTTAYRTLSASTHSLEATFAGSYESDETTMAWSDDLPITQRTAHSPLRRTPPRYAS